MTPLGTTQDALQRLLAPLQTADPSQFQDTMPEASVDLDDTLTFDPNGLPTWWPVSRSQEHGGPWSPAERRSVLLRNLKDHLGPGFPAQATTPAERQKLVDSLRHTYDGLRSGAIRILSS